MLPREFHFLRAVCEPDEQLDGRFTLGAMFTSDYAPFAERLRTSCRAHSLPLALFEVPRVHRSVSPRGAYDAAYTKANFIHFLLERYARPVLYLDADCVLAAYPTLVYELLATQVNFAAFNWLAEEHTETYIPARVVLNESGAQQLTFGRFYRFSFSIDSMSQTQLICSGAALWFNTAPSARRLLADWQHVLERAPESPDDQCLDFAFNHYPAEAPPLRARWLDKSYARYAWWIYVRPVIDHPQIPMVSNGSVPLDALDGVSRLDDSAIEPQAVAHVFPDDCLIDTETGRLMRPREGQLIPVGTITDPLWVSREAETKPSYRGSIISSRTKNDKQPQ